MTDRAGDFLNAWLGKHIGPLPAVERLAAAVRLAGKCRQDAVTAGIPLQEIRDAVGGDLIRKILQLLDIADDLQKAAVAQEEVSPVSKVSVLAEG